MEPLMYFDAEIPQIGPPAHGRSASPPRMRDHYVCRHRGTVREISCRQEDAVGIPPVAQAESLGLLAGGIAHDLNNLLTGILTNVCMERMSADPGHDFSETLSLMEAALLRAKGLTQQLFSLAKGEAPAARHPWSPAALIRETSEFFLRGSRTTCQLSLAGGLWPVEAPEEQVGQILQNLIINADQAMPAGGTITIEAENLTIGTEDHEELKGGKYIRISIQDQGRGIPQKQISRIFDPFFSTKKKGRGLGLTTCLYLATLNQGHIEVTSQEGVGTTFQVYLPATRRLSLLEESGQGRIYKGRGRILLIDDDELIRRSAGEVIKLLGYDVVSAADGAEGIALYERAMDAAQSFQAVIMDLSMPDGIDGKTAVQSLLKTDPAAKVILATGFSDNQDLSEFEEYGFKCVLAKPYDLESLSSALHHTIEENSEPRQSLTSGHIARD